MSAPIFVTGGTGMVGRQLIVRLRERGERIRALVRGAADLPDGVEIVRGDLCDDGRWLAGAMQGCARVFHVAGAVSYRAGDSDRLHRVNVLGTRHVLRAALDAGVRRVVHVSSTAAVGIGDLPGTVLDETTVFEDRLRAIPYMWTKHLAEVEVAQAVAMGLDAVIVNPSTIIGPGDTHGNAAALFRKIARGAVRVAPPGGNSVVCLDDAVTGMLLAMERGRCGVRYILSAQNLPHTEMISRIGSVIGMPPVRLRLPRWTESLATGAAWFAERAFGSAMTPQVIWFAWRWRWFDSGRARRELGWIPRMSLEEAAGQAFAWYQAQGLLQVPEIRTFPAWREKNFERA